MAVERFRPRENIVQLAKELNVPTQTLYRWNEEAEREFGAEFATEKSRESRLCREVRHLKRLLADFFNGVLQKSRLDVRDLRVWRTNIYDYIRDVMSLARRLEYRADVPAC